MPASTRDPSLRFRGTLFRALNPVWAARPLSGDGARLHGGRFNPKGTPALYTSLTDLGAVREANQIGRAFEPVTLVAYDADLAPVFDATDRDALAALCIDQGDLADGDWRGEMRRAGHSIGQRISARLIDAGYAGLVAPSFARGAPADAKNLVLWRWGGELPHRLRVQDSENRLGRLTPYLGT
ncbi:MAG: RES family NAD+ phosphorylase [Paracoccaceae bacterium]